MKVYILGKECPSRSQDEILSDIFSDTKSTVISLYDLSINYCKGILAITNIDWKKATNGHEQKTFDEAIKILSMKINNHLVYGINFPLLKMNLKKIRMLRNFCVHYDDDTRAIRNFRCKKYSKNIILTFKEINKNKTETIIKIRVTEFFYILLQLDYAYNLLTEHYKNFYAKIEDTIDSSSNRF